VSAHADRAAGPHRPSRRSNDPSLDGSAPRLEGRLRDSLGARISALVLVVLVVAGVSAFATLNQLRALQASFDRLTGVYVVFNQRLADAHVQAVRVHEQIRTHKQAEAAVALGPDAKFLENFRMALEERNARIARAREPIDDALRTPGRYGDEEQLAELRKIQVSLDQLQAEADLDETFNPFEVLHDVRTQSRITQLFESLAGQSGRAVVELSNEVRAAQQQTERLTLGLTLATTLVGVLATLGVFLALRRLRRLTQGVRNLSRGDWTQRIDPGRPGRDDEVSQLAAEFNLMAAALEERERRLLRGERLAAAGQLAAQITHEIRNPLSSVALNVELLEDELDEASPEGRHLLAQITKEVDRLTAVTEDYLGFARRPPPELVRIDLCEELRGLLEFMAPELELAGIELELDFPEGPVWVRGDSNQLRQAFMNLVRNAREAALDDDVRDRATPPQVGLRLECKDTWARVVVGDNGPGIPLPPEDLDRIFEAFYTSKARGTGLGLPTVQQILADHEGSIRVGETGPAGTRFVVEIPRDEPHESRP
jgi:two-component system, NtrC family, sensor kinase